MKNEEYINEGSNESQCKRILEHMKHGWPITSLEALSLYGCMRLASRIHDLREKGNNIIVERKKMPNGKSVASYRLA